MAKKAASGTRPGTATTRQPVLRRQDGIQPADVRHAGMRQPEQIDAVEKWRHHPRAQQLRLPREQQVPDRMVLGGEVLPALGDDDSPATGGATSSLVIASCNIWGSFPGNKKPAGRLPSGSRLVV